ncbi:uroporphyrinogen-III synthase [Cohaesibacter haloalkalitolerans]|uniref:uroporphyrinogen-III synthase n=1 Tax=Cohaesibacter haloalkalitolerans TaxID=1162980 RepID=UPI0013C41DA4|nr:uroporphyrinogen-III synthase [Cohaesibacter haloalkalitolerans]
MKILVTRPEIDQQQTIRALEQRGFVAIGSAVMDIVPLPFELPNEPWQGLVITSRNALRMLAPADLSTLVDVCLFCVGERTAVLARELGFAKVALVAANVAELEQQLLTALAPTDGPLLYLAGRIRTGALDRTLLQQGFAVCLREVYDMVARDALSDAALAAIEAEALDGILLYSERSCQILLSLIEQAGLSDKIKNVIFYCLSPRVALPLQGLSYPLVVAEAPNERSLLACLENGHN